MNRLGNPGVVMPRLVRGSSWLQASSIETPSRPKSLAAQHSCRVESCREHEHVGGSFTPSSGYYSALP